MGNAKLKDELEAKDEFADELAPGSELMHGQYKIERFLNAGGFGITYEARDSLDRRVVIKECFPGAFCRRSTTLVNARSRAHQKELGSIVRLFVQEARSLAKLDHPNIVGVHQVFEENNTAYMALDFVEGRDLLDVIEDGSTTLDPKDVKNILEKVLDAISFVHNQGILHRDISPDNILLNEKLEPVLIDFGAAREQATQQSRVLSALRVVKDGYSPQEFYIAGSEQGPFSDLYALGASFYHLLTGDLPPNSQARLASVASGESDSYVPLAGRIEGYDHAFLSALDKSLAILPKDRMESAGAWIAMMNGEIAAPDSVPAAAAAPKAAATASEPKAKSGKGMLLATVAAIAIAAVGVATQTDLLSGGSETTETAAETSTAAPATVAPATDVASTDVEAPVAETPEPAPVVAETAPADVAEPVETAEIAPAPVDPVETAPEPVAEDVATLPIEEAPAEKSIADDPIVVAEPETPAEPEVVIPDIFTAEVQMVRPEAPTSPRAEDAPVLRLNTTPRGPEPVLDYALTADVDAASPTLDAGTYTMPVPIDAQIAIDAFDPYPEADETAEGVVAQALAPLSLASVLPTTLPGLDAIATPNVDRSLAPLPPEAVEDGTLVQRGWTVALPSNDLFGPDAQSNRIVGVFGRPVSSRTEFDRVLRASQTEPTSGTVELAMLVGPDENSAAEVRMDAPVVYTTSLQNGLIFHSVFENGAWVTQASTVPSELDIEMQEGDVIFGNLTTSELLETPRALAEILERDLAAGNEVFNFAVKRGDAIWAVTFSAEASN